jgi:cytochrome P450
MLADLFIGGAETTPTTLSWAFMYLAEHPDVQEKCYKEIENVGQ